MTLFHKPEVIILKDSSDAKQYLTQLEQLSGKTQGELKERIEKEILITKAGIVGEDNILFELKNSGMDMVVLHDICIETQDGLTAQIDYIVITPKLNFIIECKNMIGNIEINAKGDFIRTYEFKGKKVKEGIYSPITQNERHMTVIREKRAESRSKLMAIMARNNFESVYKPLIVLANPKTLVYDRYAPKELKSKVIRADQLVNTLRRMQQEAKSYPWSRKEMLEFAKEFLQYNREERKDYVKKYETLVADINKVVEDVPKNTESKEQFYKRTSQKNLSRTDNKQEELCPQCQGKLVMRNGKFGKFVGCSNYPRCKYTRKID